MPSNAAIGWTLILIAGALEVLWPISMKQCYQTTGATRFMWMAIMGASLMASFALVMVAVSPKMGLPVGTAYAVWTGMGAAGAAAVGILLYKESSDAARLAFLSLIIIGIVGLKFTHRQPAAQAPAPAQANATPRER